ncbi:hypothetical protein FJT64_009373 [Amphibalanus amphitrite]|uniref:Uncharacterized protein n=1 Tax=Amphibalanus amphitrite TaxID=1232801 RepID=A0A6A4VHM3_AMPAM|nr:hypothetical protein FJT64_009373 [Amphibalanus amphitrite]
MKFVVALALIAAAAAQAPPTPDPSNLQCHCSFGIHNLRDDTILFSFRPLWENACDESADHLCQEECVTQRDVLEAAGSWSVLVPERNETVGDIACGNLGRDEPTGVHCGLYHSVCDQLPRRSSHGLFEPLCCADGLYVQCS